jgi:ABC-2 type transport system ATP-binding protein
VTVPAQGGAKRLAIVIRDLDEAGIAIDDIALRRPTLDDVFLSLTSSGPRLRAGSSTEHPDDANPDPTRTEVPA